MSLIKSVSGIRGTIGGREGDNLTPADILKYTAAFAQIIKAENPDKTCKIVVARDARISGSLVRSFVVSTLQSMGCDVVDIGLATTPTAEIAVTECVADGGIIITASHNPRQWNALKLLNAKGEFISAQQGETLLDLAENRFTEIVFSDVDSLGKLTVQDFLQKHINLILSLKSVDKQAIESRNFTIAFDAVNSVGGIAIPALLKALGIKNVIALNEAPTGEFAHNPEPLPEHLTDISDLIKSGNVNVGFVVDPDVDRLAIINEDGTMFGEEYTIVAIADYLLARNSGGNTVSNLSSSRALRDVTQRYNGSYSASAVGEVNVVAEMKRTNAVFGGEGNGGVIFPELHYGRDSLVGIALFLTHLAKSGKTCSQLRATYPNYFISKNKIQLTPETNVDAVLANVKSELEKLAGVQVSTIDGVKADFAEGWVHLRKSNTEPIIRIYSESKSESEAESLAKKVMQMIQY